MRIYKEQLSLEFLGLSSCYYVQVTFDVAWSPDGIDGRWYDYQSLSEAVDFLFVMAYDEQSQIFDTQCTARQVAQILCTIAINIE